MRSPIIMQVALVLARMQSGMIEASATRMPFETVDATRVVHHGHRIAGWAHFAGA